MIFSTFRYDLTNVKFADMVFPKDDSWKNTSRQCMKRSNLWLVNFAIINVQPKTLWHVTCGINMNENPDSIVECAMPSI